MLLALAGCKPAPSGSAPGAAAPAAPAATPATSPPPADTTPVEPIPPGQPGGLPDERTPISEAPFTPTSPQGAADVLQTYFALIETGDYAKAYDLWAADGQASGLSRPQFIARFGRYRQYSAQVGAPGETEGAAGSIFITVPVQIYGRLSTGAPFHLRGDATLRRVNDVPGATPAQLLWRIASLDAKPVP